MITLQNIIGHKADILMRLGKLPAIVDSASDEEIDALLEEATRFAQSNPALCRSINVIYRDVWGDNDLGSVLHLDYAYPRTDKDILKAALYSCLLVA